MDFEGPWRPYILVALCLVSMGIGVFVIRRIERFLARFEKVGARGMTVPEKAEAVVISGAAVAFLAAIAWVIATRA